MQSCDFTPLELQNMQFGQCVSLLFSTPRRNFGLAAAYLWLVPPIRLEQIVWTTDYKGRWTGYATWAYLSDDMSENYKKLDPPWFDLSDWNEGANLWIIDFVAPHRNARPLVSLLKKRLCPHFSIARRIVRDPSGKLLGNKEIRRTNHGGR